LGGRRADDEALVEEDEDTNGGGGSESSIGGGEIEGDERGICEAHAEIPSLSLPVYRGDSTSTSEIGIISEDESEASSM
jgi:hypothetical protein